MAKDYNSINFKNKDIDKFASSFGQGDPVKGIVSQAKDAMNTIANTPRPKGTIDYYASKPNTTKGPGVSVSTPLSMDTTGLASGKKFFQIRGGAGNVIGNVSNSEAKQLVKEIENGTLRKRKTGK